MTIKLIIFDLDGTLVESRDMHYLALNKALEEIDPKYTINLDEHLSTYDGLSTKQKLALLHTKKGLPKECFEIVWKRKQHHTENYIKNYEKDDRICKVLEELRKKYTIYIASNCTWRNLSLICHHKGFIQHIDWLISNEDVNHPKPSPQIYYKCMERANVSSDETLIIEDSPIGKVSATRSGAHLYPVNTPSDIILFKIQEYINNLSLKMSTILCRKSYNIVIPMAGHGSRFSQAGYSFPKPLIDIYGKPMIQRVVENLNIDPQTSTFIFVVQKEHYNKYDLENLLTKIAPNCKIIQVESVTEGATCTVLLAKQYIDNDKPLVIANSDQYVEWDSSDFFYKVENCDGGIATFTSSHPKWSYAKLDDSGFVSEVAEKRVISDNATVGIYYYKKGSEFVKYAEQMISKNIRVNNEFYVCPVFNQYIQDSKKIRICGISKMWSLGTPEDLRYFFDNKKLD